MKKVIIIIFLILVVCGCASPNKKNKLDNNDSQTLEQILALDNYIIVDVRTESEYKEEHIINAVNIPYDTIDEQVKLNKNKTILVYCKSGKRSSIAYQSLLSLGYEVYDLGAYADINLEKNSDTVDFEEINKEREYIMYLKIDKQVLSVTLENNSSTQELLKRLKDKDITINMEDYGNMEKVGDLDFSLPTNDANINTDYGDIILYQGNKFVIYYDKNSWSLTKLGKINNISKQELKKILGDKNIKVTLSINKD